MTIKTHGRMFTDNTVGITQLALADGTDGQAIVTDGSGTLRFATVGAGGSVGSSVYVEDIRTGDGTTATFTLSTAAPYEESILVFIDGVAQPTSSFTLPSTTSITFSPAPGNGAAIRICHLGIASSVADNAITGAKIAMGGDVAGDVLYYNGTDYQRLGIGTALQIFRTNAATTAPEWVDATTASLPAVGAAGNVLTSDASNWSSQPPLGGVGGELVSIQTIEATTAGASQTWTRPSGVKRIEVHIVGAGGYGQGNIAGGNTSSGGGAGGYCVGVYDVTNLATATVIVGMSGDAAGQMNSSFAGTGITTLAAGGGGFSDGTNSYPSTSAGGTASGGMLNFVGEQGTLAHGGGHARFGGEYGDGVDPVSGNTKLMGKNGYCYIKEYSDVSAYLVGEKLVSQQFFSTAGSGTWTKPANITKIRVFVQGPGGGTHQNGTGSESGSGGGGGCAISVLDVSNVASYAFTIGVSGQTQSSQNPWSQVATNSVFDTSGSGLAITGNAGGSRSAGQGSAGGTIGTEGEASGGQINLTGHDGIASVISAGVVIHSGGNGAGPFGHLGNGARCGLPATGSAHLGDGGYIYVEEYSDPSLVSGASLLPSVGADGNVLTSNGTAWTSATPTTPQSANEIAYVVNTSVSGAGTWTKPAGINRIFLYITDRLSNDGAAQASFIYLDVTNVTSYAYNVYTYGNPTKYGALTFNGRNGSSSSFTGSTPAEVVDSFKGLYPGPTTSTDAPQFYIVGYAA